MMADEDKWSKWSMCFTASVSLKRNWRRSQRLLNGDDVPFNEASDVDEVISESRLRISSEFLKARASVIRPLLLALSSNAGFHLRLDLPSEDEVGRVT